MSSTLRRLFLHTLAPGVGGAIVLGFGCAGLLPIGILLSVGGQHAAFMIKSVR